MPLINYDKDVAEDNIVAKISRATEINNFSDSSKIKYISSIVSNEVSNFIEIASDSIDNLYSLYAAGRNLDLKGSENSVYRNSITSLDIKDTDLVLKIEPRGEGETFSQVLTRNITIYPGEEITSGSQFRIVFTKKLIISTGDSDVYASVRIETLDPNSGFTINNDDIFKFPNNFIDLNSAATLLQARFTKPISLLVENEDDDEFRPKVIFARDNPNVAISGAIARMLQDIPSISGFAIHDRERGTGTVDIGVTTVDLQSTGIDQDIDRIKYLLESRARDVIAQGINYQVFIPEQLRLRVEYSFSGEVQDSTIADTIIVAFNSLYKYSNENNINISTLESEITTLVPSLDGINIETLSLFDTQINEYISFRDTAATAPKGTFITIFKEDIVRSN